MPAKIRYAVVGLGHISQTAVLPAFRHARKNSTLAALVTGDPEKARVLARRYKVPETCSYQNYDQLLHSGKIDAVYIALPNHLHAEYARRALKAGIHVLCEKPLTASRQEALQLKRVQKTGRARLMTAYRLHFDPANLKALELCRSGSLGDLRYFSSDFSFQVTDPRNIRLREETGGGPLWDIGIYCVNAARMLFGAEPTEVFATAGTSSDPRFREVEEMVSAVLRFPDERLASFTCSFGASAVARFQVCGTKGRLELENAYEYTEPRKLKVTIDEKTKTIRYAKADQFAPELIYFSDCIQNGTEPRPSLDEGLADVAVIEALHRSLDKGKSVPVPGSARPAKRPDQRQKMRYPPVRKPVETHIRSPN